MTTPVLSHTEAWEVRVLRAVGFTMKDLADLYEVSPGTIAKVVHGETYRDVGGPIEPNVPLADRPLPEHGRPGRYCHHGCRCDLCRATQSARCKSWRARQ